MQIIYNVFRVLEVSILMVSNVIKFSRVFHEFFLMVISVFSLVLGSFNAFI